MKDIVIVAAFLGALVCLLLAAIGRLLHTHLWLTNPTWHELAQTLLLFAAAWGIYRLGSLLRQKG
jgi:protein-S-isoprenylcysteine O-methyltransferase Ste14